MNIGTLRAVYGHVERALRETADPSWEKPWQGRERRFNPKAILSGIYNIHIDMNEARSLLRGDDSSTTRLLVGMADDVDCAIAMMRLSMEDMQRGGRSTGECAYGLLRGTIMTMEREIRRQAHG